jgi:hypothetical protein
VSASKRVPRAYLVETTLGLCVREAVSLRSAEEQAKSEHGWATFKSAKPATVADLAYVRGMGGWIPYGFRKYVEPQA